MNTAQFTTRYFQWVICGCCHGNGKVDHPAFSNGFTDEQWSDMGADWDGETSARDRYMRGDYDVACDECEGTGKVREPNFRAMPRDERRAYVSFLREQRDDADYERICAAERRMGA